MTLTVRHQETLDVGLLPILVGLLFPGALAYAVYRFPRLAKSLIVALAGAGVLAALVTAALTIGAR
ncbi:hypothetical protein [Streptomyces sp. NPDC002088]|uniref:hypothetical protein n=1 Tax=Streptomyces sp. NPDC002088 TaxID=3154665 RepID=UPI003317B258